MTDTSTEAVQTFADDLQRLQFEQLNKMVVTRNGLVGKVNAASGDRMSLTEQIRENDNDPEIAEAREQMSIWSEKLNDLVKPKVDAIVENAKGSIAEFETELKEMESTLNTGLSFYKKSYGDDAAAFFTTRERLKGTQVRSGTGTRRIRGWYVTVTIDGESKQFENFSSAAKHANADTGDLQTAFFAKAGTEDPKKISVNEVSFVINITDVDDDGNSVEKEALISCVKQEVESPAAQEEAPAVTDSDDFPDDLEDL